MNLRRGGFIGMIGTAALLGVLIVSVPGVLLCPGLAIYRACRLPVGDTADDQSALQENRHGLRRFRVILKDCQSALRQSRPHRAARLEAGPPLRIALRRLEAGIVSC